MENIKDITIPEILNIADEQESALSKTISISPIAARLIAAFIDYLVVMTISLILAKININMDWQFLLSMIAGGLYFTICQSYLACGQTLGKRAFGLRVFKYLLDKGSLQYLSLQQSFVRYLFTFGILTMLTELPEIYYRQVRLVAAPWILEFHMLLVLSFIFANLLCLFFHLKRRAIHDLLSNTIILRCPKEALNENLLVENSSLINIFGNSNLADQIGATQTNKGNRHLIGILTGAALGILFWSFGITHSNPVMQIKKHRFLLEGNFPIRIAAARYSDSILELDSIFLNIEKYSDEEISSDTPIVEKPPHLALSISKFLTLNNIINSSEVKTINFGLFNQLLSDSNKDTPLEPERIGINTETFEILPKSLAKTKQGVT